MYAVRNHNWGSNEGPKVGVEYAKNNFKDNTNFFVENKRFPMLFTLLGILGFFYSLVNHRKNTLFLFIWLAVFFVIFVSFYAGSFNYGQDDRFSLMVIGPVLIFGGVGLSLISDIVLVVAYYARNLVSRRVWKLDLSGNAKTLSWQSFVVVCIVGVLTVYSSAGFYDYITTFGEKSWDSRVVHHFAFNTTVPEDCYVLTHIPTMFLFQGYNSIIIHAIKNKNRYDELLNKTDCLIFYEEYWCVNSETYREGICKHVHENFNLTVYRSVKARDKEFSFYFMNNFSEIPQNIKTGESE